jgi:hypothetical protein
VDNLKEEGRRKKEEGRNKKEEGRVDSCHQSSVISHHSSERSRWLAR